MNDFPTYTITPETTDTKTRKYYEFSLKTSDPFGFWTISFLKGGHTPAELKGHYTSYSAACLAVDAYRTKVALNDDTTPKSNRK